MQPARSSASQTGITLEPADSISSSASRAASGHGVGSGCAQLAKVVGRDRGEHQAALRRERSGPQADERIAGICVAAQPDLTGVDDQPVIGLDVVGPALPLDEAQHPALRNRLPGRPYGQVDRVPDPAGRQAHVAMKIVGVVIAQAGGDCSTSH